MLVDVHCHLTHPEFSKDLNAVLERARNAGVKRIVTAGTNKETNRTVMGLWHKHPDIIRPSLGMYPLDAIGLDDEGQKVAPQEADQEIEFIYNNKKNIVCVGEIGLDYKINQDPKQTTIFQKMLDCADHINKPVVVHSRAAEREVVEILCSRKTKAVLHCFCGRKSLVRQAAKKGTYFSIPPILLRSSQFAMIVKEVDINQLLTETDAPWLSNVSGERNEPAHIARTITAIASIKGMDPVEVENNLFLNYQKLFMD